MGGGCQWGGGWRAGPPGVGPLQGTGGGRPRTLPPKDSRDSRPIRAGSLGYPLSYGRVLTNAWSADEYMTDVLNNIVFGTADHKSLVNRVMNSPDLSKVFNGFVQKIFNSPFKASRIKNLKFKKHRYDSMQRPLSRIIVFFEAFVMTAVWILVHRAGTEVAKDAEHFLLYIDNEKAITLGMCADAADEVIVLIRYLDRESYEIAHVILLCLALLNRIKFLFVDGNAVHLGYTSYIMNVLKSARVFHVKGEMRRIGGVIPNLAEILARCLGRMACWVKLAVDVVDAEVPTYKMTAAFSVLDVSGEAAKHDAMDATFSEHRAESIARLAQTWRVDAGDLWDQVKDYEPIARALYANAKLSIFEAWREAYMRVNRRSSTAANHPSGALKPILVRLGTANGCTTSGVEQEFHVHRHFRTAQRDHMSLATTLDEVRLKSDLREAEIPDVISRARAIWNEYFQPTRRHKHDEKSRIDLGIKRKALFLLITL